MKPTALSQVLIAAFTCFCCPGLFNALSSVAAGVADESIAYNGSSLLYGFFAVAGLLAGGVVNVMGPKWALFLGTWGYVIYAISLLAMDKNHSTVQNDDGTQAEVYTTGAKTFFYISNSLLGICAGFLWTAQGQMCMAYPTSETKGKYFSWFWIIFNLGATMGGLITFGTNYNSQGSSASTTTYIVFLILMSCGCFMSLTLAKPENVIRNDGSVVKVEALPDWKLELIEVAKLFVDPKMLLLFPLFAYSNWFYTYHSFYNVTIFNSRSGGLASAFYWGAQMVGAYCIGLYLDAPGGSRKTKALKSLGVLTFLISVMWGLGLWAQLSLDLSTEHKLGLDFKGGDYWVKLLLYFYYGLNDAICQVWSYWLMGQMSDDLNVLGRYAGYYKGVQSGMSAISWKLGGINLDPVASLLINWILAAVGLIGAYISIHNYVDDVSGKPEYTSLETPANKIVDSAVH